MKGGRIVTRPTDGKHFHVGGWKRRPARGPRLRLAHYLDHKKLAPVPDCDWSTSPSGALATKLAAVLSDVLGNDRLGDCTCAGYVHVLAVILANAGIAPELTATMAVRLYELACGYVQGDDSTDQGGNELDVLDFVAEHGIDGQGLHKSTGSIIVDASNVLELRWAIYNLLNVYYGVGLPNSYVDPFPSSSGFVWGVDSPNPQNGHCFIAYGVNAKGTLIDTWGELGLFTLEAQAALATDAGGGECHAIITPEIVAAASQKSPTGFAFADLLADAKRVGMFSS